jgi:serine/threonine protein phosphatase PrpC
LAAVGVLVLIACRAFADNPKGLVVDAPTPRSAIEVPTTDVEMLGRQLDPIHERPTRNAWVRPRIGNDWRTSAPLPRTAAGLRTEHGVLAAVALAIVEALAVVRRRFKRASTSPRPSMAQREAQPLAHVCRENRASFPAAQVQTAPVALVAGRIREHLVVDKASVLERLACEATVIVGPVMNRQRLGFYTHRGFVREHNEDCVFGFEIECQYFICASDGVGGEPEGARTARNAVRGASRRVIEVWGGAARRGLDPATVAAVSLSAAQREIMRAIGLHRGVAIPERGCRATLLVAVVDGDRLGFAYIGDGGGCVRRADTGQVESFVTPMKAAPGSSTIVGSLGPELEGEPNTGCIRVGPGDLVLLGTDGIFDRVVLDDLCCGVMAALRDFRGDIPFTLKAIVDDLAGQRGPSGHLICDDNMSLAAIVVPEPAGPETTTNLDPALGSGGSEET